MPDHVRAELVEPPVFGVGLRHQHMQIHALVDLRRDFEPGALTEAMARLLAAYPVLGCRFEARAWRARWVPLGIAAGSLVHCEDIERGALAERTRHWVGVPFEPAERAQVRLVSLSHPGGSRLLLSVAHLAADGAGALALTHALGRALTRPHAALPEAAPRDLGRVIRAIKPRDWPVLAMEIVREGLRPLKMLQIRRRDPPFAPTEGSAPDWRTIVLEGEARHHFVGVCKGQGATVNDGLVGALALVEAGWRPRGPSAVAYTINLRRFLPDPGAVIANLSGVSVAVLPRRALGSLASAARAAAAVVGEQKRRLPGLAFNLFPALLLGWMPHGISRMLGGPFLAFVFRTAHRALVLTNVGPMDTFVAPFGDEVVDATILGPFSRRFPVPVAVVTGFQGRIKINLCSAGDLDVQGIERYQQALRAVLSESA